MKYSTGRGTRCKHSTAMEWDEYEKKKRRARFKYSTGKGTTLRHSCGTPLEGDIAEQGNHPDLDFESAEDNKHWKSKRGKGFKKLTADY